MKNKFLILITIFTFSLTCITNAESLNLSDSLNNMEEIINYIDTNYYLDVDKDDLIKGAYKGIFATLDEHSTYIEPLVYEEVQKQLHGSYVGIGIMLEESKRGILITNIYGGSPAEVSGLEIGDEILSINGLNINTIGYNKGLDLLLGESGTEVIADVLKKGTKTVKRYRLIREVVDLKSVIYEIKEDGIGYIRIVDFADNTAEKVKEALANFEENSVDRFVLDLRNNPGGLIDQALEVLDIFIEENKVLLRVKNNSGYESKYSENQSKSYGMVVLVNKKSASASEIVCGTLKYYNKAIIVGTNSHGKGTMQKIFDIGTNKEGAYRVTIAEFLLPNDMAVNNIGISPDVYVENYDDLDFDLIGVFAPMPEKVDYNVGEVGLNVFGMEQRLNAMGYSVKADGVFDLESQKCLIDFQNKNFIEGNGQLNSETITVLNKYFELAELSSNVDYQLDKALEILELSNLD